MYIFFFWDISNLIIVFNVKKKKATKNSGEGDNSQLPPPPPITLPPPPPLRSCFLPQNPKKLSSAFLHIRFYLQLRAILVYIYICFWVSFFSSEITLFSVGRR